MKLPEEKMIKFIPRPEPSARVAGGGELVILRKYVMYYEDNGKTISHLHASAKEAWDDAQKYIDKGMCNTFFVAEILGKIMGRQEYNYHKVIY